MEVRVLGPVEVVDDDGTELTVGSPKQRELLELLAAHVGEVVSTDRIIDALWGESGGRHLSSLRYHVSKLRDAIDPGRDRELIRTQEPGYTLAVRVDAVDVHRFTGLVLEAETIAPRDPVEARGLLADALVMWRGTPYAEFEYAEWARSEVVHLTELWLRAVEMRNDADLDLGGGAQLVPQLEALVVAHPLREAFWRQLMLALYRSHRQPDALRAYRQACDAFGELGTVPSPDLHHLEERSLSTIPRSPRHRPASSRRTSLLRCRASSAGSPTSPPFAISSPTTGWSP
jgi:DNA-binding SARP family transcriptional activator